MGEGHVSEQSPNSSIDKALTVLDAFAGSSATLRIADIAERTGMPKSTVHRLLATMVAHGYIRKSGIHYRLGERTFELGHHAQVGPVRDLRNIAHPYVAELFATTRQTIHLAVLSGTDVLYVEKMRGLSGPDIPTQTGRRRPAHSTGVGKALIAFGTPDDLRNALRSNLLRFTAYTVATARGMEQSIARIREAGIAVDREESFLGVTCVAAPVIDRRTGTAVAAMSISGSTSGGSPMRYRAVLEKTAEQLSRALSGRALYAV